MVDHDNATPLQLRSGNRDRPSSSVDQLDLAPGERPNGAGRLGRRLSDAFLDAADLDLMVIRVLRRPSCNAVQASRPTTWKAPTAPSRSMSNA
jgi:hypothetical protein